MSPAHSKVLGEKVNQRISAGCWCKCLDAPVTQLGIAGSYVWLQHVPHGLGEPRPIAPGNEKTVSTVVCHEARTAPHARPS